MNDAERGIAAYRATAAKLGQAKKAKRPKKREHHLQPPESEEVEVRISGSGAPPPGRPTAPPERDNGLSAPSKRREEPGDRESDQSRQTETLLKKATKKNGYRRVAKFLLLLGKDEAVRIIKHFDKGEAEQISFEIARIKHIDNVEAQALLAEFGATGTSTRGSKGGPAAAKAMLIAAFGESRANQILGRVVPETREKPFQFLVDIDYQQVVLLLKNEGAPAISIILPHLPPQKASKVLGVLSPELQREVIRRIAKMKTVNPEVIVRIEAVLKERIRAQGRVITEEIDGQEALANILKHLDYSQEEKILDDLAASDPEISQNVRDRLFTIDLVFKIDDQELEAILRDYDDSEIAVILKAKNRAVQDRILSHISSRRQAMVKEEMDLLGKMRKSDVDQATKDFVDYLVDLDVQRKITIHWDDQIIE